VAWFPLAGRGSSSLSSENIKVEENRIEIEIIYFPPNPDDTVVLKIS